MEVGSSISDRSGDCRVLLVLVGVGVLDLFDRRGGRDMNGRAVSRKFSLNTSSIAWSVGVALQLRRLGLGHAICLCRFKEIVDVERHIVAAALAGACTVLLAS